MKRIVSGLIMIAVLMFSAYAFCAEMINGAGATFPYPLYSSWASDYNKITGMRLNYQSIGSGGGQRQISERTVDFGASDDPLKPEQLQKDRLLQFPAVIGGIVPVINIPGLKANDLKLDSTTLANIFLGRIKFWDDPSIKTLNSGLKLPHIEIIIVYRADGSGTTAIFTNYLAEVSNDWKTKVGAGKAVKFPAGIGAKGNEGVSNYVKRSAGTIGYVEFAYAKQNNLVPVQLKNRAGNFVAATFETFSNAAETADFDAKKDFYVWLTNAPGKNSWPIAGATFILLAKERTGSNTKVVKFFEWAQNNGDTKAKQLVYVPLPKSLKEKVRKYWVANGIK